MPRITKEWRMAEELVATKGQIATAEALAKAMEYEAEGYHPAARSWREIAAWCEAICLRRHDLIAPTVTRRAA